MEKTEVKEINGVRYEAAGMVPDSELEQVAEQVQAKMPQATKVLIASRDPYNYPRVEYGLIAYQGDRCLNACMTHRGDPGDDGASSLFIDYWKVTVRAE